MTDLQEKVLAIDEYCLKKPELCDRDACPYYDFRDECLDIWFSDALKVLKAQEPKTAKEMLVVGGHLMGKCPRCYKILTIRDHPVACGFCGQAVKWNDQRK